MKDKQLNLVLGAIFVVLISAGFFMTFFQPTFTGNAINVGESGGFVEFQFENGNFESTRYDLEEGAVVLDNSSSGVYISEVFDAGEEVNWNEFAYFVDVPQNSSLDFSIRGCDDGVCDTETFEPQSGSVLNFTSRYFQFKSNFNTLENSPKIYEVNATYSLILSSNETNSTLNQNNDLSVIIDSPAATTYDSQSILVKITSNASNIWTESDGENLTYSQEFDKVFVEGDHILIAWVNDSEGNMNSSSVSFTVSLPEEEDEEDTTTEESSSESDTSESESTTESSSDSESDSSLGGSWTAPSGITSNTISEECEPEWNCGEWSECINESQSRTCEDIKECGVEDGMPELTQSCEPVETCFDGLRNQDEAGIDCGGVCDQQCNFFVIMGNAVSGPIESGKEFFLGNRIRTIIIGGTLGFFVVGVLILRIHRHIRTRGTKPKKVKKSKKGKNDIDEADEMGKVTGV